MINESIKEILKTKSMTMTRQEIEAIMDEELEKDPDVMDADLVELCLDALEGTATENGGVIKKKGFRPFRKILLIAAVITLLVAVSVPIFADNLNIELTGWNIQYEDGKILLNKKGTKSICDILAENGIENPVLPAMFFEDDVVVTDYEATTNNSPVTKLEVFFSYDDTDNNVLTVVKVDDDYSFADDYTKIKESKKNVSVFDKNGITICVLGDEAESNISYVSDLYYFDIGFENLGYEKTKIIAETI